MVIIFAVQPVDSVRSFGPGVHYCARGTKLARSDLVHVFSPF